MQDSTLPLLHVYPQYGYHDDAYIVANKAALLELKEAIENAINTGRGSTKSVSVSDGEGFNLNIICINEQQEFWDKLYRPYTADWCKDNRTDCTAPGELWYYKNK